MIDPDQIFRTAEIYRASSQLLHDQIKFGRPEFTMPGFVCSAFATELYLKCLLAMETGAAPPRIHNLSKLFDALSNESKREIRDYFSIHWPQFAIVGDRASGGNTLSRMNFDGVLDVSQLAFERLRYLYEITANPRLGWLADHIREGTRARILKLKSASHSSSP